jgi:hypothetical protein
MNNININKVSYRMYRIVYRMRKMRKRKWLEDKVWIFLIIKMSNIKIDFIVKYIKLRISENKEINFTTLFMKMIKDGKIKKYKKNLSRLTSLIKYKIFLKKIILIIFLPKKIFL